MLPEPGSRRNGITIAILAALAVVAVVMLPLEIHHPFHMWQIGGRFVLIAALLLLVAPSGEPGRWRTLAMVPALAAGVVQPLGVAADYRAFNKTVVGFDQVIEKIPFGADTLGGMNGDLTAANGRVRALRMFPQYVQILRGGYSPHNFSVGFPMAYKQERPAPDWLTQNQISFRYHAPYYDYVLRFRDGEPHDPNGFVKVVESGGWKLYKNTRAKRPPPAGHKNPPNR